jgi:hypothetical protein
MIVAVEPNFTTKPELAGIFAELIAREPIFHRPEFGATRADFERMTADDFWETGASGRRYTREFVLDVLEKDSQRHRKTRGKLATFAAAGWDQKRIC